MPHTVNDLDLSTLDYDDFCGYLRVVAHLTAPDHIPDVPMLVRDCLDRARCNDRNKMMKRAVADVMTISESMVRP